MGVMYLILKTPNRQIDRANRHLEITQKATYGGTSQDMDRPRLDRCTNFSLTISEGYRSSWLAYMSRPPILDRPMHGLRHSVEKK